MIRSRWIGWISAAVALIAIAMVLIDIIQTQAGRNTGTSETRTVEADRSAGTDVAPMDPKQTPAVK
jgi:hypothetical protein